MLLKATPKKQNRFMIQSRLLVRRLFWFVRGIEKKEFSGNRVGFPEMPTLLESPPGFPKKVRNIPRISGNFSWF